MRHEEQKVPQGLNAGDEPTAMFTSADIADLARIHHVNVPQGDLAEVATRLSVIVRAIDNISTPSLETVDPAPVLGFGLDK
jgi:hypothetical protein